jgi:intracellular sulfur oxidation DsrE/DsrF family protein
MLHSRVVVDNVRAIDFFEQSSFTYRSYHIVLESLSQRGVEVVYCMIAIW